jgi:hypothetical protein
MDAIRARTSIRSYSAEPLDHAEVEALEASFIEACPGPFGGSPRFALLGAPEGDGKSGASGGLGVANPSTFGVIGGAPAFIAGVVASAPWCNVDFGYCLEGIILRATELGLGTCWLGGFFDRGAIARAMAASRHEITPACTPVGRPSDSLRLQDRAIRLAAGSRNRKPWSELFFREEGGTLESLPPDDPFAESLEVVRIGPSASNKQPWRIVVDRRGGHDEVHLFLREERFYNNVLGAVKLQELDMGIAMRHFEVSEAAVGRGGGWKRLQPEPLSIPSPMRYIATWIPE